MKVLTDDAPEYGGPITKGLVIFLHPTPEGVINMEGININYFRELFLRILDEDEAAIQRSNKQVASEINNEGDEADSASLEREETLCLKLKGRKSHYIRKVRQALARIDQGLFGICEHCDEPIETNRLKARPTANLCISCKEEEERFEGHVLYSRRSHTLGRSMKVSTNVINFPQGNDEQKSSGDGKVILNNDNENSDQRAIDSVL